MKVKDSWKKVKNDKFNLLYPQKRANMENKNINVVNIKFVAKTSYIRNFFENTRSDVKTSEVATLVIVSNWSSLPEMNMNLDLNPADFQVYHGFLLNLIILFWISSQLSVLFRNGRLLHLFCKFAWAEFLTSTEIVHCVLYCIVYWFFCDKTTVRTVDRPHSIAYSIGYCGNYSII